MSDLLNERPKRKILGNPISNSSDVVYFVSTSLFMKRGKKMEVTNEISTDTISALSTLYPNSIFLIMALPANKELAERIYSSKGSLDIRIFNVDETNIRDTNLRLKKALEGLGLQLFHIKNPRTVSYLNIHKFVVDSKLVRIEPDDYASLKISPEKEATFEDLARVRRKKAWI